LLLKHNILLNHAGWRRCDSPDGGWTDDSSRVYLLERDWSGRLSHPRSVPFRHRRIGCAGGFHQQPSCDRAGGMASCYGPSATPALIEAPGPACSRDHDLRRRRPLLGSCVKSRPSACGDVTPPARRRPTLGYLRTGSGPRRLGSVERVCEPDPSGPARRAGRVAVAAVRGVSASTGSVPDPRAP